MELVLADKKKSIDVKRIVRCSVSVLRDESVVWTDSWTYGEVDLEKDVYGKLGLREMLSFDEFYDCVESCKKGSSLLYVLDDHVDLVFKKWTIAKKR